MVAHEILEEFAQIQRESQDAVAEVRKAISRLDTGDSPIADMGVLTCGGYFCNSG